MSKQSLDIILPVYNPAQGWAEDLIRQFREFENRISERFDANKKYKSMGLENIKSRVNYLQGTIDIDSRIGQGTSFIIHLNSQFRNVSPT